MPIFSYRLTISLQISEIKKINIVAKLCFVNVCDKLKIAGLMLTVERHIEYLCSCKSCRSPL